MVISKMQHSIQQLKKQIIKSKSSQFMAKKKSIQKTRSLSLIFKQKGKQ